MERGLQAYIDIQNTSKNAEMAGNSPLAKLAAIGQTAGHMAGNIAGGVGDIIRAFISPFIPKQAQEVIGNISKDIDTKISEIPGMTPELHKSVGDVIDT